MKGLGPAHAVPVLLAVFLALSAGASRDKSAIFDEPLHLYSGWRILTAGDFATNHEHPPLMKMLAAVPLLMMDVKPPTSVARREVDQWQVSHQFVYHVNDGDRLLAAARLPVVLLAALLGYVLYRCTAATLGKTAGVVALGLFAFEPNILAHSSLITTDLGITALMFFTFNAFAMHLRTRSRNWLLAAGVLLGLSLLTKFTAVLLPPILALGGALIVYLDNAGRWKSLLLSLAAVGGIGLLVLNVGYGFGGTFSGLDDFTPESRSFREYAVGPLGGLPLALPVEYVRGFDHAEAGGERWWSYLFGEHSMTGWPHYYLAALAVKTPLPLLLLSVAGLALWPFASRQDGKTLRPGDALLPAVPLLAVLFAFTFSGNLKNIGLRYILPVYPFLCVIAATATRIRFRRSWMLYGLVVWQAGIGLWMYPDYLTFFNLTVGGPSRGREVLLDSNLDWGQDLKGLGEYIEAKGIDKIYVDYFGRSCMSYYGVESTPDFEGGYIAVSATQLMGVYSERKDRYSFLWDVEPEAIIGGSIHVYNVPRPADWQPKAAPQEE